VGHCGCAIVDTWVPGVCEVEFCDQDGRTSVSTRVVSWKDAAEMNESVGSEALVIPIRFALPWARRSRSAVFNRVGQTLASAVRGDEVLEHVQAFAELHRDEWFNDLARRFGPQATHTGKAGESAVRSRVRPSRP